MSETALGKKIMMMASELGHRLFRCNTAQGWVGESTRFTKETKIVAHPGDVLIRKARPLHAGLVEGGSDYIGWTKDGKFLAIETKIAGKTTQKKRLEEQLAFIDAVTRCGGVAGMVTDEESAFELLA